MYPLKTYFCNLDDYPVLSLKNLKYIPSYPVIYPFISDVLTCCILWYPPVSPAGYPIRFSAVPACRGCCSIEPAHQLGKQLVFIPPPVPGPAEPDPDHRGVGVGGAAPAAPGQSASLPPTPPTPPDIGGVGGYPKGQQIRILKGDN